MRPISSTKSIFLARLLALASLVGVGCLALPFRAVPNGTQPLLHAGWSPTVDFPPDFLPQGLTATRSRVSLAPEEEIPPLEAIEEAGDFSEFIATRKQAQSTWQYATKTVREGISAGLSLRTKRDWKYIVLHSSATSSGSAKAFDYYHRKVKGMQHGLAYHFVITNGAGGPDGQIQIGPRWRAQEAGGHLHSDKQNEVAIGICFVGDFQKQRPTAAQLRSADELIGYLQAKMGKIPVTIHRKVNTTPTLCPGKYFPSKLFIQGQVR